MGEEYQLVGEEDPEYVHRLAQTVDQELRKVSERSRTLPLAKVAILACLNLADELHKVQEDYDSLIRLLNEEKGN